MNLVRATACLACLAILACIEPADSRPGTWLSGEVVAELPSDWSFTNASQQILIQVATPYRIPHAVTIWCAALDGALYVGARNPDTKRWPAWADRDPNVRLGIAGKLYDVALTPLDEKADAAELARVRAAYAEKYPQSAPPPDAPPAPIPLTRYWRVGPRG